MTMAANQLPLFADKGRRRRAPPAIERRTHIALADVLRRWIKPGWYWTHLPAGEYRTEATGKLLKRMGLQPGLPDFMLISPQGKVHFLELKRRRLGRLTAVQEDFGDLCAGRHIPYALARSFDEGVATFGGWGALRAGLHWQ